MNQASVLSDQLRATQAAQALADDYKVSLDAMRAAVLGSGDEARHGITKLVEQLVEVEAERDTAETALKAVRDVLGDEYAPLTLEGAVLTLIEARDGARRVLDRLYGAVLHDMTARDLPHEWAPDSAMGQASAFLAKRATGEGE